MAISFNSVPSNLRVPIVTAEFDNSHAAQGPALLPFRALLIGQKLRSAPAAANSLHKVTSEAQVIALCGRGSMLHRQAKAWFAANKSTEAWIGVLDDASSASLASGTLTVTGPSTADGTMYLYVGGQRVTVAVANGDSASVIAGNIANALGKHASGTITAATAIATNTVTIGTFVFVGAAGAATPGQLTFSIDTGDNATAASIAAQINAHAGASALVHASAASAVVTVRAVGGGSAGNAIPLASSGSTLAVSGATLSGATADTDLAVHASVSGAVVTTRAMNAGAVANELDIRANYNDGEALPAGVGLAIVAMSGGAVNPTLATLIANMGDTWFNVLANAYTDATSLGVLETELVSRFGPMRMIDGVMFSAKADTYSAVATLGESRNCPHNSIVRTNNSPTPPEEYAAHVAAVVAFYGNIDPARPFQTLPLPYVKAPALADRDTIQERNLILFDGISTTRVDAGDIVVIERLITTYQTNAAGQPDPSYLDTNTMFTLMYLRFSFRARIAQKYPRHKLADDGTRFGAGQAVITPKIGKSEAVAWFEDMEELGLVEDVDQFKNDLIVERNVSDRNRLDWLLPPNIINQLIVGAAQLQFIL